jgi:hypothetical protein
LNAFLKNKSPHTFKLKYASRTLVGVCLKV